MPVDDILHIAEVEYDDGQVRMRFSRYVSEDGSHWIRHGRFTAFHRNGQLATEGHYDHGVEQGTWRDYHENGVLAAEGAYRSGKKDGLWRYWDSSGQPEEGEEYLEGELISPKPS